MNRPAQIRAFEAELEALAAEGVAPLTESQRAEIATHQAAVLARLSREAGVDITAAEEQLSLGMRLASFVGAVALSSAVFFLFYRFWGTIPTGGQVTLLVAAPLLLVAATHFLHRWEKTGYFATLAALTAFAAFVLDLSALGQIFNLPETANAFLAWGAFGIVLGLIYELRLPHLAGLIALGLWICSLPGTWRGESVGDALFRPEAIAITGGCYLLWAHLWRARMATWRSLDLRIAGMIGAFIALFALAVDGSKSWFDLDHDATRALYQSVGIGTAAATIWWGVRSGLRDLMNGGMIFLTVILLVKMFDSWWDDLPRWLFFLLIAGMAIGIMLLLRWVRARADRRPA